MKIIPILFMCMFLISFASAYAPHQQNTNLSIVISSNNATTCNVSYIQYPNGNMNYLDLVMTKNGNSFNQTILNKNFTQIGEFCFGLSCSDGVQVETGSTCREVTPSGNNGTSNIVFFLFVVCLLYAINLFGFFGKNIPMTILGGMALIFLGVYMINYGIIIYRDTLTLYVAYITISWGTLSALWAGLEQLDIL